MIRVEPVIPKEMPGKTWGRELLFAHAGDYTGRVSWMRAGAGGPYQYHERKDETFYLLSGLLELRTEEGVIRVVPGMAFHIPPGAKHQVRALADAIIVEASNAVFDDRVPAE